MKINAKTKTVTIGVEELARMLAEASRATLLHCNDNWDLWTAGIPDQISQQILRQNTQPQDVTVL